MVNVSTVKLMVNFYTGLGEEEREGGGGGGGGGDVLRHCVMNFSSNTHQKSSHHTERGDRNVLAMDQHLVEENIANDRKQPS